MVPLTSLSKISFRFFFSGNYTISLAKENYMYVKSVWYRRPASPGCDKVTSQLSLERNCECFLVCHKCRNFRFDFVGKKSDLIRSDWNVWDLWTRGSHSLVGSTENFPSHMDKPYIRMYPGKLFLYLKFQP